MGCERTGGGQYTYTSVQTAVENDQEPSTTSQKANQAAHTQRLDDAFDEMCRHQIDDGGKDISMHVIQEGKMEPRAMTTISP